MVSDDFFSVVEVSQQLGICGDWVEKKEGLCQCLTRGKANDVILL